MKNRLLLTGLAGALLMLLCLPGQPAAAQGGTITGTGSLTNPLSPIPLTLSITFPPAGGAVSGFITGQSQIPNPPSTPCTAAFNGTVSGTFAGGDGGAASGSMAIHYTFTCANGSTDQSYNGTWQGVFNASGNGGGTWTSSGSGGTWQVTYSPQEFQAALPAVQPTMAATESPQAAPTEAFQPPPQQQPPGGNGANTGGSPSNGNLDAAQAAVMAGAGLTGAALLSALGGTLIGRRPGNAAGSSLPRLSAAPDPARQKVVMPLFEPFEAIDRGMTQLQSGFFTALHTVSDPLFDLDEMILQETLRLIPARPPGGGGRPDPTPVGSPAGRMPADYNLRMDLGPFQLTVGPGHATISLPLSNIPLVNEASMLVSVLREQAASLPHGRTNPPISPPDRSQELFRQWGWNDPNQMKPIKPAL